MLHERPEFPDFPELDEVGPDRRDPVARQVVVALQAEQQPFGGLPLKVKILGTSSATWAASARRPS